MTGKLTDKDLESAKMIYEASQSPPAACKYMHTSIMFNLSGPSLVYES